MEQLAKNLSLFSQKASIILDDILVPTRPFFDITTFGYRRFLKNGKSLGVSNNEKWNEYFCKNLLNIHLDTYEKEVFLALYNKKNLFCRSGIPKEEYKHHLYNMDIWNSITLYSVAPKYVEAFYFTSTVKNKEHVNIFMENIDALTHFSNYFSQKINFLFNQQDVKKMFAPTISESVFNYENTQPQNLSLENFLRGTTLDRYTIENNGKNIQLTKKDIQTLYKLSRGYSIKKIGRQMSVSHRTIETRINTMKKKLQLKYKNDLIEFYHKTPSINRIMLFNSD